MGRGSSITPRGQRRHADGAPQTCRMLRAGLKLALRQTKGFMHSVLELMGVNIAAPHHSTVSRRAAGQLRVNLAAPTGFALFSIVSAVFGFADSGCGGESSVCERRSRLTLGPPGPRTCAVMHRVRSSAASWQVR